ncbi:MAG: methyltransferase [Gemmataceae bacterium]
MPSPQSTVPPQAILMEMISGTWRAQALHVAAYLGIADLLATGPRSAADLARATSTNGDCLHRLLRALASVGVFAEDDSGRFALTPLAEPLRADVPGSIRPALLMMGPAFYRAWGELLHSIRTGETAFNQVFGKGFFDYLAERPKEAATFDAAMTAIHGAETEPMLDAYDFSRFGTLVDMGGGNGSNLLAVLKRHPKLRGVLFDLPHVVDRARANIRAAGLEDRCTAVGGSFFETAPPGDAYILRHIIHDWDDDRSIAILRSCRRAMNPGAKLLVVESVIPPGNTPFTAKWLDLNMMVIPGGLERTEAQYRALYEKAGWRLTRIVPTRLETSVVEGEAVP